MSEPLTRGQQKFAGTFARETGLDPRVVGAWLKAEQSGSAAENYERRGYHNWLNIANTDSGPAGGAHSAEWRDPEKAGRASAEWIKGKGRIASEYGRPAAGIMGILHTAGKSPDEQIRAIAGSGWASSGYEGGNTLRTLYHELSGHQLALLSSASRQAGAAAGIAPVVPERSAAETHVGPVPNPVLEAIQAIHHPIAEPGSTQDLVQKNWEKVGHLFDHTAPISQSSTPEEQQQARTSLPGVVHEGRTKLGGFLSGHAKLVVQRIDQGQDGYTDPGGAIIAPARGFVVRIGSDPSGFGPRYPVIKITDPNSPLNGKEIYLGHTLAVLKAGDTFVPGQTISHTGTHGVGNATVPGWFEIGFASALGSGNMSAGNEIHPYLVGHR